MHLKPTAESQISTLIFEKKNEEGGLYKYPIKIYQGRQCSCPSLVYFSWDIYRDPLHNIFSNIKVDI
jgi:hypothetical protein